MINHNIFKQLAIFFISFALAIFFVVLVESITTLRHDVDMLQAKQQRMETDMDALWLNQKEMVGTVNALVNSVEQLKDQQGYIDETYVDPEFDMSGTETPISPTDNRFE